jgi:hypothetical protein
MNLLKPHAAFSMSCLRDFSQWIPRHEFMVWDIWTVSMCSLLKLLQPMPKLYLGDLPLVGINFLVMQVSWLFHQTRGVKVQGVSACFVFMSVGLLARRWREHCAIRYLTRVMLFLILCS